MSIALVLFCVIVFRDRGDDSKKSERERVIYERLRENNFKDLTSNRA